MLHKLTSTFPHKDWGWLINIQKKGNHLTHEPLFPCLSPWQTLLRDLCILVLAQSLFQHGTPSTHYHPVVMVRELQAWLDDFWCLFSLWPFIVWLFLLLWWWWWFVCFALPYNAAPVLGFGSTLYWEWLSGVFLPLPRPRAKSSASVLFPSFNWHKRNGTREQMVATGLMLTSKELSEAAGISVNGHRCCD